jgi:hypothetical protein
MSKEKTNAANPLAEEEANENELKSQSNQKPAQQDIAKKQPAEVYVDEVENTKRILDNGPHTNFIIPVFPGESEGSSETVQINGYRLTIKKGVMVNIPLAVANLLAEKYHIAMTAGQDKRLDRDAETERALS